MRPSRILAILGAAAVAGLSISGFLAWRAVTVEQMDQPEALRRFEEVRKMFGDTDPILTVDAGGTIVRRGTPPERQRQSLQRVGALVYRSRDERLVTADIPFWFFKVKGPAIQYALRDTGVDLLELGVTAGDLERHGPTVVLDQVRPNGDRVLVWTE